MSTDHPTIASGPLSPNGHSPFRALRGIGFIPCALLLGLTAALPSTAQTTFRQKLVEFVSLEDTRIPTELRRETTGRPWTNLERGPVSNLMLYATESGGASWLGSPDGAARFDPAASHPWDRWQFFAGPRWFLNGDHIVKNLVLRETNQTKEVWIRTPSTISRIEWRPLTLRQKADHYETLIERHHLRHGFVADCRLREPGRLETSFTIDNDNDGLWTAMYLAAQSYRYAVTREAEAQARATRAFDALVRLLDITGHPGFPARSIAAAGENHDNGEWHATPDGHWLWKGDTSSDELVGHYYGHAVFYDLASTPEQKETCRRVVRAITDHLLSHDDDLIDLDGKPTRWGQWSQRYFATEEGRYERALRALELLSFLKTTAQITGDAKYAQAYADRVARGYADFIHEYRRWPNGGEINFSDDELAYLSWDPLLRYENDPQLLAVYRENVRFLWGEILPDQNPLWNFISAACGAGDFSREAQRDSLRTLQRIPWLPLQWSVRNSIRQDVSPRPGSDRFGRNESTAALAPDERPQHKWNGNPYIMDGGGDGRFLECGTYFLLPYWMGRHHGWIRE